MSVEPCHTILIADESAPIDGTVCCFVLLYTHDGLSRLPVKGYTLNSSGGGGSDELPRLSLTPPSDSPNGSRFSRSFLCVN